MGPYEIVSPLGAGGMGEVYRGEEMKIGAARDLFSLSKTIGLSWGVAPDGKHFSINVTPGKSVAADDRDYELDCPGTKAVSLAAQSN